nr:hypothetical protein [Tanacetum cinerariifolium]
VVPRNYNPKGERFLIASRFPTPPLACAFFSLRATETSSLKLARDQTSNPTSSTNPTPKGRIRRSSKQKVENSYFEEHLTPVATMTDNRTMAEMLRAPTEGCAEAIIVPPILAEPFLITARALIDVHGKEMILRDGDESEDCLDDLVSNKQSGNPTFSLHKEIASLEVIHEINDSKGCTFLSEFPDIDSFNDIHPYFDDDPLSGNTTYSANSLLEEFDVYPDDFLEIESDATFDDDSFDSEGEKIKEAGLLIDQLDLHCDILSEYDSFNSQDFFRDDVLPSPDNEDK